MGNLASADHPPQHTQLSYAASELQRLFQYRCMLLLKPAELAAISAKINMRDGHETDAVLTNTDLAHLLRLHGTDAADSVDERLAAALRSVYGSFTVLARLPLLRHPQISGTQLTLRGLVVALVVYLGRIYKIWPQADFWRLLFAALALEPAAAGEKDSEPDEKAGPGAHLEDKYTVDAFIAQDSDDPRVACRRIRWQSLDSLSCYDGLDFDSLSIPAFKVVQVLALLLMVNAVPPQARVKMQQLMHRLATEYWAAFEAAAVAFLRSVSPEITERNLRSSKITFAQFAALRNGTGEFLPNAFSKLFKFSIQLSVTTGYGNEPAPEEQSQGPTPPKKIKAFSPSRLVDGATISLLSVFLANVGTNVEISSQNLIELYNGSQTGFSIRSLELKIFKWQAPTIFLVSGKRLRNKTISKNKRYQAFDSEFPRFFRSSEDPKRAWQSDTDKVTFAVYVNEPWRHSNKANFGDTKTAILAMLPRYDYFEATRANSVYFNNQGMGIGFGNEQPVNKNNVRKYMPGNVSLTIEANLEFGVFRHIVNAGVNTPRFFGLSLQAEIQGQDYEDRFVITDLEVWGVGSTKELEEQRKQWEWEEKQAQDRQGVNMRNIGEDRALLELAGLVGNHGGGGSM